MTVEYSKKSKKFLCFFVGFLLLLVFLVFGSFYNENKGETTQDQWSQVSKNMSEDEVVKEVGRPKSKSSNTHRIKESYSPAMASKKSDKPHSTAQLAMASGTHDLLGFMEIEAALEHNKNVQMYHYLVDGKDHYIYFVDELAKIKY